MITIVVGKAVNRVDRRSVNRVNRERTRAATDRLCSIREPRSALVSCTRIALRELQHKVAFRASAHNPIRKTEIRATNPSSSRLFLGTFNDARYVCHRTKIVESNFAVTIALLIEMSELSERIRQNKKRHPGLDIAPLHNCIEFRGMPRLICKEIYVNLDSSIVSVNFVRRRHFEYASHAHSQPKVWSSESSNTP